MKQLAILSTTLLLSFSAFAGSICNFTLLKGSGSDLKQLVTLTKYVKIAEAGYLGTLYQESENVKIELFGVINSYHHTQISLLRTEGGENKTILSDLTIPNVGQAVSASTVNGEYTFMLACVAAK